MPLDLDDPTSVVLAAVAAFDAAGTQVLVYGGMALAMFGEPRETRDADLVSAVSAEVGHAALSATGVMTVITFAKVRFGGLTISRLTLLGDGKLNVVDLIAPRSERYRMGLMERRMTGNLDGQELGVVSPEDFILLKVLSTRDRDIEDARTVVTALSGRLDLAAMNCEAAQLVAEIPDHDIAARYARVMR